MTLGLKIRSVTLPKAKYGTKCPYTMTSPIGVTVHNTYNDASAAAEIAYMQRNNNTVSFHLAVDDQEVVQGIPLNRNAWHAGDGTSGTGNRKTISIEICYSKSGGSRYDKAEDNAAKLVAMILKQYGWKIGDVYKHQDWSGKYCPHRILDEGRWDDFLAEVETYLESLNHPTQTSTKEEKKVNQDGYLICYKNDGDFPNACALFNAMRGLNCDMHWGDPTPDDPRVVIQVGGASVQGADKILSGSDRIDTLETIGDFVATL